MKLLMAPGMAIAAALALAACGGGGGSSSTQDSSSQGSSSQGTATTVSVKKLPAVGSVLVDPGGKAVYSSDLEAGGKVVCSAACTAFWKPVTVDGGKPTAPAGAGKLDVIRRPDGAMQVTDNGKPLYTFSEDSPGKATGDGFTDDFAGHHFTWHVVSSGGKTGTGAGSKDGPSPGYDNGGSGSGY
jgi:predicted lipoprotein with Yx(FWY)xxD motif